MSIEWWAEWGAGRGVWGRQHSENSSEFATEDVEDEKKLFDQEVGEGRKKIP